MKTLVFLSFTIIITVNLYAINNNEEGKEELQEVLGASSNLAASPDPQSLPDRPEDPSPVGNTLVHTSKGKPNAKVRYKRRSEGLLLITKAASNVKKDILQQQILRLQEE